MKYRFQPTRTKKQSKILSMLSIKSLVSGAAPDMAILYGVLALLIFGWVMVYSASALFAETKYHDQYYFLKRQVIWSGIGLVCFLAASNLPLAFWQKIIKPLYAATVVGLVLVLLIGPSISGARRWIRLGGLGFQPSELAKLAMILVVADYLDRRQSRLKEFSRGLLPILILVGLMVGLILLEPDLGTPVLMCSVFLMLLILGGARWRHLITMAMVALPFIALAIVKVSYRLKRFFAYLDPWSDAQGAGYQLVQSLLALGSGGFFGRGLGNSKIKISSLPDCHTDFIFAILGEELGLMGTLTCAGLFLFLCTRGLKIAQQTNNCYARLVATGISLMIGFQAIINMGVASGLFPTKGMPLPFISFGGSSLMILLTSVGILSHISRNIEKPSAPVARR
jgi:cell division protein FtsW